MGSSETLRQTNIQRLECLDDKVRTAWRHAETGRNGRSLQKFWRVTTLSEVPCRVRWNLPVLAYNGEALEKMGNTVGSRSNKNGIDPVTTNPAFSRKCGRGDCSLS